MCVYVCAHGCACRARWSCALAHSGAKNHSEGKSGLWRCLKVGSPLKGGGRQREEWEENIVQFLPFQSFELT